MITDFIINVLFFLLGNIVVLFPDVESLPDIFSSLTDSLETMLGQLGKLNAIFPIDTLITLTITSLIISTAIGTISLFNWLYDKVRGAG